MRNLLVGFVPVPLVFMPYWLLLPLLEVPREVHLLGPLLVLIPTSAIVACIRHNLWDSRRFLSRALVRAAIGVAAVLAAAGAGTAISTVLGAPTAAVAVAALGAATTAMVLGAGSLRALDEGLFGARSRYKPAVSRFSAALTSADRPDTVVEGLRRIVAGAVPSDWI